MLASHRRFRACLKIAFCQMCVTVCGRFGSNEGVGYVDRMRAKYTAKWGAQMTGMNFQTRSSPVPTESDKTPAVPPPSGIPAPSACKCPSHKDIWYENGTRTEDLPERESPRRAALFPGCAASGLLSVSHSKGSGYKDAAAVHTMHPSLRSRISFPET